MKYAVIKTGSKQYIVQEGDFLNVELLGKEEGKTLDFDEVLLVVDDDKIELGKPKTKSKVTAKVMGGVRDDKKTGIKYKSGGYRRKFGHRQSLTRVEIVKIT